MTNFGGAPRMGQAQLAACTPHVALHDGVFESQRRHTFSPAVFVDVLKGAPLRLVEQHFGAVDFIQHAVRRPHAARISRSMACRARFSVE